MSDFWRNWLTIWCIAVAVFGAVLMGGAFEATSGPVRLLFDVLDGPGDPVYDAHFRFSLALMGAVTFGWSGTFYAAFQAAHALERRARPIWLLITASALGWYAVDSALSIATGFAMNAASNTVLLIGYLVPLFASGVLQSHAPSARTA